MHSPMRWCCLLALASGCVSASKHELLEKKYAFAQAQLAGQHSDNLSLKEALAHSEELARDLGLRLETARGEVGKLEREQEQSTQLIASHKAEGERLSAELADLVKDRSQLKESTDRLKQAVLELAQRKAQADQRVAEYKSMLSRFKQLIDAGTLAVRIVEGRMVLVLPADVLFDSGSARLSKVGKAAVLEIGSVLATLRGRRVQVEGHTDNVPIHNASYASNWELAAARAFVVLRALVESGVASDVLSAASYGEYRPSASNDQETGRGANRRIEIVLPPDLSMLPGIEEVKQAIAQP